MDCTSGTCILVSPNLYKVSLPFLPYHPVLHHRQALYNTTPHIGAVRLFFGDSNDLTEEERADIKRNVGVRLLARTGDCDEELIGTGGGLRRPVW